MENKFHKKISKKKKQFHEKSRRRKKTPQNFKIGRKNLLPLLNFYLYDFSGTG